MDKLIEDHAHLLTSNEIETIESFNAFSREKTSFISLSNWWNEDDEEQITFELSTCCGSIVCEFDTLKECIERSQSRQWRERAERQSNYSWSIMGTEY